jgi:hypothetical protein
MRLSGLLSLLLVVSSLVFSGCQTRPDNPPTAEEQLFLNRLTRDAFVIIESYERNEFEHLIVNTQQGSQKVRYIIKPVNPGSTTLNMHRINDRAMLDVGDADYQGTFQAPTRFR